jgi:hypothetical protein
MEEILYKDYSTFRILDKEIFVYSQDTEYGRSTVVQIDDLFYYVGEEPPDLETSIFVFCDLNNRDLTEQEYDKVLEDNPEQIYASI